MSKSDKFKLSSGLPWADTTITITDASFGYTDMNGNSVLCLVLSGTNSEGDEGEQSFSVGQGWEAVEGGARLQAENGKDDKPFSKQSNVGKLIASMIKAVGGDPEDIPFEDPMVAEQWVGHTWRTGTVQEPAKQMNGKPKLDDDGNPITRDRIVFEEYVGQVGGGEKVAAPKSSKASKASAGSDIPEALLAQLTELANSAEDHDEFSDRALDIDEVSSDSSLVKRVMNAKGDGLYAQLTKG